MGKFAISFMVISFLAALLLIPAGSISFSQPPAEVTDFSNKPDLPSIPNSYIVVLNDDVSNPRDVANEMALLHGLQISHVYSHAIKGYSAVIPDSQLSKVLSDDRVSYVDEDYIVSISAPGGQKGPPSNKSGNEGSATKPAQVTPTGILRINGDLSSTVSGDNQDSISNVAVAVIDTGIKEDHYDLNVVGGVNCQNGPANKYDDGNGHGTHVSGTIGAYDDAYGVVGVAPGVPLYAVRVLNNAGSGSWSSVICGVDWVAANADKIEVANMSLGGTLESNNTGCSSDAMHQAICTAVSKGVTFVVAAGNQSKEVDDGKYRSVPAEYDEVITVSALADFDGEPGGNGASTCRTDDDDTFANFSNYGAEVDIIAPGVCILSTWNDGGLNTISGTSMASPHVAGAAALYISSHQGVSPAQVKNALQSAGNLNWDNSDDGDGIKEKLLDVGGF